MNMCVQLLAIAAMVAGARGSMLFVDTTKRPANYEHGSMVFLIGNATNVAVGLHIGDMSLVIAQAGLAWYTLPMYNDKIVSWFCSLWVLYLVAMTGLANHFSFTASWLGVCASAVAVYGAWAMSKAKWDSMNWSWVIADLAFIYIAIQNRLIGLGILASLFVWHGYLRIKGWKRHGLFGYSK